MNIFITGITGFLGGHLARRLAMDSHKIIGVVRDGHKGMNREADHWIFGDVLDLPLLERALAEYEIDAVIHLAAQAQVSVANASPDGTFDANVRGTWNMLEACRRQKVRRVIVASTDKVYGSSTEPFTESSPLIERSPYAASKVCADILAQTYAKTYGMKIAITRCGNFYGLGHLNYSTLIPCTIRRVLFGNAPLLHGDGSSIREFLHIRDACEAYAALVDMDESGPFNFGGGEPKTIRGIVDLLLSVMGRDDVSIRCGEPRAGDIAHQSLDCTKARMSLGWKPRVSFREGLEETVAWYRERLTAGSTTTSSAKSTAQP